MTNVEKTERFEPYILNTELPPSIKDFGELEQFVLEVIDPLHEKHPFILMPKGVLKNTNRNVLASKFEYVSDDLYFAMFHDHQVRVRFFPETTEAGGQTATLLVRSTEDILRGMYSLLNEKNEQPTFDATMKRYEASLPDFIQTIRQALEEITPESSATILSLRRGLVSRFFDFTGSPKSPAVAYSQLRSLQERVPGVYAVPWEEFDMGSMREGVYHGRSLKKGNERGNTLRFRTSEDEQNSATYFDDDK